MQIHGSLYVIYFVYEKSVIIGSSCCCYTIVLIPDCVQHDYCFARSGSDHFSLKMDSEAIFRGGGGGGRASFSRHN